jgi:hypothetical protein
MAAVKYPDYTPVDEPTSKAKPTPKPKPAPPPKPATDKSIYPDSVPVDEPVKKMASGGMTASKRADGCATKGKTRGKMV